MRLGHYSYRMYSPFRVSPPALFTSGHTLTLRSRKLNFPFLPDEVARWISLPAILAALIAFDIVGLRRARFGPHGWSKIDHASHVGGHATGILAALAIKRRARNRKEEDEMQRKVMKIVDSLEKK